MFRLHLDIGMGENLEDAKNLSQCFLDRIKELIEKEYNETTIKILKTLRYRLLRDDDRQPKNFLNIDDNGHASGKKAKMFP